MSECIVSADREMSGINSASWLVNSINDLNYVGWGREFCNGFAFLYAATKVYFLCTEDNSIVFTFVEDFISMQEMILVVFVPQ